MQKNLNTLEAAGVRVAAISVDDPSVSRSWAERSGFTFAILSDPQMNVIRRFDVAVEDEGIARPAEFLIDSSGVVRWRNLTDDYYIRARPDTVLDVVAHLQPPPSAR
jgi:peroxiredoxin